MVAVFNVRLAGSDDGQYRPHKVPANRTIFRHAVDAGGILLNSYCMYFSPALGRHRKHARAAHP
jgi:hypothetical protein